MNDYISRVVELLKSFETGDSRPLSFINPAKYIQHNVSLGDGVKALADLVQAIPKGSVKVNTLRAFRDGDYVFTHSEYDFGDPMVGFDIFRFENGLIVEHWDNLQKMASKPSHSMVDGPRIASDEDKTDANKALLKRYMDEIFVQKRRDRFASYFDGNNYVQHNPLILEDGLTGLLAGLQALAQKGLTVEYDVVHMILGEGDFVLVVNEGSLAASRRQYTTCTGSLTPRLPSTGTLSKRSHPATHGRTAMVSSDVLSRRDLLSGMLRVRAPSSAISERISSRSVTR